MEDAVDVAASPWMNYDEKIKKLEEMGATKTMINMAFRKVKDTRNRFKRGGRW